MSIVSTLVKYFGLAAWHNFLIEIDSNYPKYYVCIKYATVNLLFIEAKYNCVMQREEIFRNFAFSALYDGALE